MRCGEYDPKLVTKYPSNFDDANRNSTSRKVVRSMEEDAN